MKKLRCVGKYRNGPRNLGWDVGTEFEVEDHVATFLFNDAPDCFVELDKVSQKALDRPPENKVIQEGEAENKAAAGRRVRKAG